ncbi:dephospho-CoA kinase [Bacillus sp. B15-48]|uniref:dephospho-CoA kinase n=1 Tax=Bacillus sp. B15-48 TaxID=1548601 RepID=UPI00193FB56B|nr:dephospho-CoA kinase [Bacillus sp. B15-48]MBM4762521.1 dephospho-CoA kinase [Bacillus sp. B15-48]
MSLIIGLTGGIASGKSTVSQMLTEMGITVIDADVESRLAVEKGEKAYNDIVRYFGKDILDENGVINRAKLGAIIFNDEEKRLVLNSIVHPAVRERMEEKKEQAIQKGEKVVVLDIPLLIEGENQYSVDKILLIYVDEEMQLRRLMERNHFSVEEARSRINSQMPLKEKVKHADKVIDNNGTIEETAEQVKKIVSSWGI